MGSGSKRSTDRRPSKPYSIAHTNANFVIPPRYAPLAQNQYSDSEVYYAQNRDQIRQMNNQSFNVPRKVDRIPESYQYQVSNSLNYPALQHTSLDENMMPSTFTRQAVTYTQQPHSNASAGELQYSVEEMESIPQSQRNFSGFQGADVQMPSEKSPQGIKTKSVSKPVKSSDNLATALMHPSAKHLCSSNSLNPSSESSQLTILCLNLYEILNKNKIVYKHNSSEEPPAEMISKMFDSIVQDLRLRKEMLENMENESKEKDRAIEAIADKKEIIEKANSRLKTRIEEMEREMCQIAKEAKDQADEARRRNTEEVDRYKGEIERLREKARSYEFKNLQLQEEANDVRSEAERLKIRVQELKDRVKVKDDAILKAKMERDRMNNSVEYESIHGDLIKGAKKSNRAQQINVRTMHGDESDDLSRCNPSGEKKFRDRIEIEKGEMFEYDTRRDTITDHDIEATWFYKALNELFSPYMTLKVHDLFNCIRERYEILSQCEDLMQLKVQIEIILNLPSNCSKSIIINKIKEMRTTNLMSQSDSEVGIKIQDFDNINKKFEAYEEMKDIFELIKSSLKLQSTATFSETLKAVKKVVSKKTLKNEKKRASKLNPESIALRKTKIDLDSSKQNRSKASPSCDNRSPAVISGPASARNDKASKVIFSKINNPLLIQSGVRIQPQLPQVSIKRSKEVKSTSCKKGSPHIRKTKPFK